MEIVLMKWFDFPSKYIVPNVSFGANIHECDLLVITKSGYASEVEIKVSLQDLKKDKEKRHGHRNYKIKELWFAVPEHIPYEEALKHIPERAGLVWVYRAGNEVPRCKVVKLPIPMKSPYKWNQDEIFNVLRLAAMRIYSLKRRVYKSLS